MSLDFLSLAAGGPPARSPLADGAPEGALIEQRDGWDVVVSYGDPEAEARACHGTVGWADRSHLAKAELSGSSPWLEPFEPGLAVRRGDGWACPLTPERSLLLGGVGDPPGGALLDLSCSLGAISIVGPAAGETIARFCAIDTRPASLPDGGFRPGSIARTPGYLLREESNRFLLVFGAAYGTYMWEVVADAGSRLGGRAVGSDVVRGTPSARTEVGLNA